MCGGARARVCVCVCCMPYLVHGVQQLGELVETLPVLAGVLLALHYGFSQLFDVRHADLVEHRLALQAVLGHCRRGDTQGEHTGKYSNQTTFGVAPVLLDKAS